MREIKFRMWNPISKTMIDLRKITPLALNMDTDGLFIPFCGMPLMQYTGIKDKHGIEIYEGDLISFSTADRDYRPHVVYFGDGCFHVKIRSGSEKGYEPCLCLLQHIEVTGNIHETPEKA